MPQIECSVSINRSVSEVFSYVADFRNAPKWQGDVEEVFLSDSSLRVGVMVTQTRKTRLLGWRLDLNADIITYQPNKLIEYKGILGRFPIHGEISFSSSRGVTEVSEALNIRMGFLYGIYSPFLAGTMRRRTNVALQSLKTMMENRTEKRS